MQRRRSAARWPAVALTVALALAAGLRMRRASGLRAPPPRAAHREPPEMTGTWRQRCCIARHLPEHAAAGTSRAGGAGRDLRAAREAYQRTPQGSASCAMLCCSRRPVTRRAIRRRRRTAARAGSAARGAGAGRACRGAGRAGAARPRAGLKAENEQLRRTTEERGTGAQRRRSGVCRPRWTRTPLAQAARSCAGQARRDRHIERNLAERKAPNSRRPTVNQPQNARRASWSWMTIRDCCAC